MGCARRMVSYESKQLLTQLQRGLLVVQSSKIDMLTLSVRDPSKTI